MTKSFSERGVAKVLLSPPAAIFYGYFAVELHRLSVSPARGPALAAFAAAVLVRASVASWIADDAEARGSATYDLASFVFFLPLLGLFYLFRRRGGGGAAPLVGYIVLVLAGMACAWLPYLIAFLLTGKFPAI